MALEARKVIAFDIDARSIEAASRRCNLFELTNVTLLERDTSWIDAYSQDSNSITAESVDLIFCYALLEHLLPPERIKFLSAAWRHLKPGGHLVIVECPNRLTSYDWHTGKQYFTDWLPDDLLMAWYGRYSDSAVSESNRAPDIVTAGTMSRDPLYRNGRGVSFHEFELAIGLQNIIVSAEAPGRTQPGYDPAWEEALVAKFAAMHPQCRVSLPPIAWIWC
jgi:SAM-dependent methyltransferase